VSGLLDAVDATQGIAVVFTLLAFLNSWIELRQGTQAIAMALFVAATAHTSDGFLALKTGTIRWFGKLRTGTKARAAAIAKATFGIAAFMLSFAGILVFAG